MKLIFFAPFSGIWEHAELEARAAAALQKAGHAVTYITCAGVLRRHCVTMAAKHLPANASEDARKAVCRKCRARADAVRREFGLAGPKIDDLVGAEELGRIDASLDRENPRELAELRWHDIPVGRRAFFPLLVYKKKDDLDLDESQWREYRDQLHQTMVAVSAARNFLAANKADRVLTYSATYSVISTFLDAAQSLGVAGYFTEASGNLAHRSRRAILGKGGIIQWFGALRSAWPSFERHPADASLLGEVGDHAVTLFGAASPFSYSTAAGSDAAAVRSAVQAPPGAKLLLATMSSHDEWFAAEAAGLAQIRPSAFPSQLDWLDWLVDYARQRPEVHLVIRVHPREFPNRREHTGLTSSHSYKLRARLVDLPPNCVVNWPSQQLSLYDLAKAADVVLNAWSSAGKEMALLGLPVVEWAPDVLLYPPEPRYCGRTPEEYALCIQQALEDGWREANIVRMFRWCALEYGAASYVTRNDPSPNPAKPPLVLRAVRRLARERVDAWIARRNHLPAESVREIESTLADGRPLLVRSARGDAKAEAHALATQIDRMKTALFPRSDAGSAGLGERLSQAARHLRTDH